MPILLFFIAGGMLLGSVAVLDEANHQRACKQARDRQALEKDLLSGAIEIEELRARARDLGLDPDKAVSGYEALRLGDITVQQVQQVLGMTA